MVGNPIIIRSKITGRKISIVAKSGEFKVGLYNLSETATEPRVFEDYMASMIPKRGIPRRMLMRAVNRMQQLATRRGEALIHRADLQGPDCMLKLAHIFRDLGYKQGGRGSRVFTRSYEPHEKRTLRERASEG